MVEMFTFVWICSTMAIIMCLAMEWHKDHNYGKKEKGKGNGEDQQITSMWRAEIWATCSMHYEPLASK